MNKVEIVFNEQEKTITYKGEKSEAVKAQKAVSRMLTETTRKMFASPERDFVRFLLGAKLNPSICKNVLGHLQSQHINAILTVDDKCSYLWGNKDDCESAVKALNESILSVCVVPISPDMKAESWNTIKNLEATGFIKIIEKDAYVRIVGFRNSVGSVRRQLQSTLIDDDLDETIELNYERGKMKYITKYIDFKKICSDNSAEVLNIDDRSIKIRGQKNALEKVKKLSDSLVEKIVHTHQNVDKFRILDFMESAEGKTILEQAGDVYKVVIKCKRVTKSSQSMARDLHQEPNTSSIGPRPSSQTTSGVNIGNIMIQVEQGDIRREETDAIVISAGLDFKNPSMMAKGIFDQGGRFIKDELNKADGRYLRVTSAGKLGCKRIFHVTSPLMPKDISLSLWNIFKEAEERKCKSISIPALGTGISSISEKDVAKIMMETLRTFAKDPNTRHVKTINVIIYEAYQLSCFERALNAVGNKDTSFGASAQISQGGSSFQSNTGIPVMFGPLEVSVRQGDITEERNDAIVNSTGSTFNLSRGLVSSAIIRKGGRGIQGEVYNGYSSEVRVSSGGNLHCRKILHMYTPSTTDSFISRVVKVLEIAEKERCKSISFPAIGTGNLCISVGEVARAMVRAFDSFSQKHPVTNHLKKVDLVIFDQLQLRNFTEAVRDYGTKSHEKTGDKSNKNWFQNIPAVSYLSEKLGKAFLTDEPMQKSIELEKEKRSVTEFHMFSLSKDTNDAALQIVLQEVDRAYKIDIVVDEYISHLSTEAIQQIDIIEQSNKVQLTRSGNKIKVEGLTKNVVSAVESLRNVLLNGRSEQFAKQNPTIYIWQKMNKDGNWELLPPKISDQLENLSRNQPTYSGSFKVDNTEHYLNLRMYLLDGNRIKRAISEDWLQPSSKTMNGTNVDRKGNSF